ncbi:MAG: hypothetical protein NT084_03370 [Bacteroidetes bacterium]|jgi:hypothetical protein|nr:hypothetical protein [Bacteroidota bacterium]
MFAARKIKTVLFSSTRHWTEIIPSIYAAFANTLSIRNFLAFLILISIASCKKKSPDPPPCIAGQGGFTQVVIFTNHGSTPIYFYATHPDTVFVKYNTLTSPGNLPSNYDTYYVSDYRMVDHFHCPNLKCGDYYFKVQSFDSLTNSHYTGGFGITVNSALHEQDTTINVN